MSKEISKNTSDEVRNKKVVTRGRAGNGFFSIIKDVDGFISVERHGHGFTYKPEEVRHLGGGSFEKGKEVISEAFRKNADKFFSGGNWTNDSFDRPFARTLDLFNALRYGQEGGPDAETAGILLVATKGFSFAGPVTSVAIKVVEADPRFRLEKVEKKSKGDAVTARMTFKDPMNK